MGGGSRRRTLALCWLKYLTEKDISGNTFPLFDAPVSDGEIVVAKECVNRIVK